MWLPATTAVWYAHDSAAPPFFLFFFCRAKITSGARGRVRETLLFSPFVDKKHSLERTSSPRYRRPQPLFGCVLYMQGKTNFTDTRCLGILGLTYLSLRRSCSSPKQNITETHRLSRSSPTDPMQRLSYNNRGSVTVGHQAASRLDNNSDPHPRPPPPVSSKTSHRIAAYESNAPCKRRTDHHAPALFDALEDPTLESLCCGGRSKVKFGAGCGEGGSASGKKTSIPVFFALQSPPTATDRLHTTPTARNTSGQQIRSQDKQQEGLKGKEERFQSGRALLHVVGSTQDTFCSIAAGGKKRGAVCASAQSSGQQEIGEDPHQPRHGRSVLLPLLVSGGVHCPFGVVALCGLSLATPSRRIAATGVPTSTQRYCCSRHRLFSNKHLR